jgi:hypothetical protein
MWLWNNKILYLYRENRCGVYIMSQANEPYNASAGKYMKITTENGDKRNSV